jgi:hypothetical protein
MLRPQLIVVIVLNDLTAPGYSREIGHDVSLRWCLRRRRIGCVRLTLLHRGKDDVGDGKFRPGNERQVGDPSDRFQVL